MSVIDISVPIKTGMVVWPGDPEVAIRQVSSIRAGDESNVSQMRMSVHTGTHIDAPRHFIENGKTVGEIPMEKLTGEVLVLDMGREVTVITEAVLVAHPAYNDLERARKVLFKTQNSTFWSSDPNEFRKDYVGIDLSGALVLAGMGFDLIGVDYLSVAPFSETQKPHQVLLKSEIVLLEGIDLSRVTGGWYKLYCLPLNLTQCEGAPARAILVSTGI